LIERWLALEGSGQASKNAGALLAAFCRLQLPVIHIQHVAKRAGAAFFLPDTDGVKIHTSVAPLANETVIDSQGFPDGVVTGARNCLTQFCKSSAGIGLAMK